MHGLLIVFSLHFGSGSVFIGLLNYGVWIHTVYGIYGYRYFKIYKRAPTYERHRSFQSTISYKSAVVIQKNVVLISGRVKKRLDPDP